MCIYADINEMSEGFYYYSNLCELDLMFLGGYWTDSGFVTDTALISGKGKPVIPADIEDSVRKEYVKYTTSTETAPDNYYAGCRDLIASSLRRVEMSRNKFNDLLMGESKEWKEYLLRNSRVGNLVDITVFYNGQIQKIADNFLQLYQKLKE